MTNVKKTLKKEFMQFTFAGLLLIIISMLSALFYQDYYEKQYYLQSPYLPIEDVNFAVKDGFIEGNLTITKIHECTLDRNNPPFFKWIISNSIATSEILVDDKKIIARELLEIGKPVRLSIIRSKIPDEVLEEKFSFVSLNVVCDKGDGLKNFQLLPEMIYLSDSNVLEVLDEKTL